ncbi:Protein AIR2 [Escovopsis weberi]|uniref:Protein AIR2 n=1 Tax=Escovopsis weberi TaxID=150374 RepID=A0A0M8MV87_ESCWE|nr:Protein AIR2 [Escovopsis weberi]
MASKTLAPGGRTGADFISISSSDDDMPSPKRKRSSSSSSSSKSARVLPPVDGSSGSDAKSGTRASEEGEIGDIEDAASDESKNQARGEGDDVAADAAADSSKSAEGASSVFVPQDPPLFVQDSISLRLPVFSQRREGSWHTRLQDWIQLLLTSNPEHAPALTPSLVHAAYKQFIDCHSGLKQGKRRGAKEASAKLEKNRELAKMLKTLQSSIGSRLHEGPSAEAPSRSTASGDPTGAQVEDQASSDQSRANGTGTVAKKTETSITDVIVLSSDGPQGSEAAPPVPSSSSPAPSNGLKTPAVAHRKGVPLGADALAQQRRYFPSAVDPASMCLLCGREGHIAVDCQDSLGHSTAKCIEKLALTKDEGLECFYCKSPDHLEDECTEWWRSYEPLAHVVKTISHLPSSCAACGSGQHDSGDCPQRRQRDASVNPTWTSRNRNLYVDPASSSSAIEESYSQVGKPKAGQQSDLRIRGSAAPRTHIQYESEDSDVEFLGQRASVRKPKIGQIRVSSNIQMPNENRHHAASLPLAPPRATSSFPPPPGTRVNTSFSLPTGPPPSLPSRPPVRTFHAGLAEVEAVAGGAAADGAVVGEEEENEAFYRRHESFTEEEEVLNII